MDEARDFTYQAFLSHSHSGGNHEHVMEIARRLHAKGVRGWVDEYNLPRHGASLDEEILSAVRGSACFIAFVDHEYLRKVSFAHRREYNPNYCLMELNAALRNPDRIAVVCTEECGYPRSWPDPIGVHLQELQVSVCIRGQPIPESVIDSLAVFCFGLSVCAPSLPRTPSAMPLAFGPRDIAVSPACACAMSSTTAPLRFAGAGFPSPSSPAASFTAHYPAAASFTAPYPATASAATLPLHLPKGAPAASACSVSPFQATRSGGVTGSPPVAASGHASAAPIPIPAARGAAPFRPHAAGVGATPPSAHQAAAAYRGAGDISSSHPAAECQPGALATRVHRQTSASARPSTSAPSLSASLSSPDRDWLSPQRRSLPRDGALLRAPVVFFLMNNMNIINNVANKTVKAVGSIPMSNPPLQELWKFDLDTEKEASPFREIKTPYYLGFSGSYKNQGFLGEPGKKGHFLLGPDALPAVHSRAYVHSRNFTISVWFRSRKAWGDWGPLDGCVLWSCLDSTRKEVCMLHCERGEFVLKFQVVPRPQYATSFDIRLSNKWTMLTLCVADGRPRFFMNDQCDVAMEEQAHRQAPDGSIIRDVVLGNTLRAVGGEAPAPLDLGGFEGMFRNLALWNCALSSDEVRALYMLGPEVAGDKDHFGKPRPLS